MPKPSYKLKIFTALSLAITLTLSACQQPTDNTANDTATAPANEPAHNKTAQNEPASTTSTTSPTTRSEQPPEQPSDSSNQQIIKTPITILALGDSLTEGLGVPESEAYPAQLEEALHKAGYINAKVVNSGLSGETSTGLVNRLDWVLQTKPDITILTIGANDAMRGIDVATIEANIRTAIKKLQDNGSTVILGGMQIYDNLGDDYVQSFYDIYPKVAEDTGVAFIPFFLDGVAGEPNLNQADAIHPTADGYTRIVEGNILPVLKPVLVETVAKKETEGS